MMQAKGRQSTEQSGLDYKRQRLFEINQCNMPLQVCYLIVELVCSRREYAGIEEIVFGVTDTMVVQDQERISRWQLR